MLDVWAAAVRKHARVLTPTTTFGVYLFLLICLFPDESCKLGTPTGSLMFIISTFHVTRSTDTLV